MCETGGGQTVDFDRWFSRRGGKLKTKFKAVASFIVKASLATLLEVPSAKLEDCRCRSKKGPSSPRSLGPLVTQGVLHGYAIIYQSQGQSCSLARDIMHLLMVGTPNKTIKYLVMEGLSFFQNITDSHSSALYQVQAKSSIPPAFVYLPNINKVMF
ncbi:hypothetical protein KM043_016428 [Ampulex compressa]|nr:hypothetical protein KM043_016428 [Ampulex compressa]